MVKFSVIIPLYNKEQYIKKTIYSILSQSYQDFEIIVIDDGSKDKSAEIVHNIPDNRIRLIQIENGGVSKARNHGISISKGDFITFLDGDDLWLPNHLYVLNNLILKFPECGMLFTAYEYIYENSSKTILKVNNCPDTDCCYDDYCEMVMKNGGYTNCWTGVMCIKKELIHTSNLFPIGIKTGEDLDVWLRIGIETKIAYSNIVTAQYLQEATNNSQTGITWENMFNYSIWYSYSNNPFLKRYTTNMLIAKANYLNAAGRKKRCLLFFISMSWNLPLF